MNWVNELLDLYEKNEDKAGKIDAVYVEGKDETKILPILLPVSHVTVTAQITVAIDNEGNFQGAEKVSDNDKLTVIPVTEKSASRTAGTEPHPLCDNLKYLAGDHFKYYQEKNFSDNYQKYISELKKWIKSEYTHKKAEAIYKYLSKGCLIEDLVKAEVIKLDENGRMTDKEKIQGISQADAFVRFKIISDEKLDINDINNTDGSLFEECWKDRGLQKSFIDYYSSASEEKDISYLTGNLDQISYLQPKKIRNEGDGGKLISSNDEVNFTYRGRFENKYQAFSIGYTDSQKMHNALKWIIRKQGFNYDSLTVVVWESSLSTLPSVIAGTNEICNEYKGWDDEDDENTSSYLGTYEEGAKRFDNAMCGYKNKLLDMDYSRTVLLAFDAATTGRVSMVEYKNLETSRYFENIQNWHNNCMWAHRGFNKQGKPCAYFGVPSPKEIAEALYGTEQNGRLSLGNRSKLGAEVFKRLLPCIIDKKRVPSDMVQAAIQKASSPVSYEKHYNWEKVLSVACSLIKKQRKEKYEEEWKVALDLECTNRDYLFGRLLAVADWAEYRTYDNDQSRETNAQRYMSAFSQRPLRTWKVIEGKVIPYLPKLKPWERKKYTKIIEEIYDKFTVDSFDSDESLGGLYLLGFHSQSLALKYSPNKEQENKEDNENE